MAGTPVLAHLRLLAALQAMAVAAWLTPASVHIVHWPASGPTRLALLAPTWQLLAWTTAALATYGAVRVLGRTAPAARILTPFMLLWLVAVPYLPWLPDRLPLLLVLGGPLRWVLVAGVGVRSFLLWRGDRPLPDPGQYVGRRMVFAASLALYLVFGLWNLDANGIGGDEPHYLVITESLLRDGDLDIENNHQRGDYRAFFRGDLRPDFLQRGLNGVLYSIHAPGLPALLLPVYAVAGHRGAVAFIALMGALAALAVFDLGVLLAGSTVAVLTWLAVCLTVPFIPHSWSIFPEMPGALLVAWGVLWLVRPVDEVGAGRWVVRGLALSLLPWLHTKFIVFLAVLSLGFGLRLLRQVPRLLAIATPIALSCAAWLASFYVMYGTVNPEAPYGAYTQVYVLTSNIPHGLLGLFFDQKFGLLVYSPVYLLAVAGAWIGLRDPRHRFVTAILLLIVVGFVGSTARLYMFWGGSSAPARFFVPLLPCLAPFIALALSRARSVPAIAASAVTLAASLGVAAVGIASPERLMLFSNPHGRARILELLQGGSPLSLVLPTFTDPDWPSHVVPLVLWVVAAGVGGAVLVLMSRLTARGPWAALAASMLAFLAAGAAFTARPPAAAREATAVRGDLDVLWRYDRDRFRPFAYDTLERPTRERVLELATVRLRPSVLPDAMGPVDLGPLELPPGEFEASVWFNGGSSRDGEVLVAGPRTVFGRADAPLSNPARFPVVFPVAGRRVVVRVPDATVARAITEVRLEPHDVPAPSQRDPRPVRAVENLGTRPGAYLVYTDGDAYPEMGTFWTRGTAATTVLVAPGGAPAMTLTLSTGPMSGTVSVTLGGQTRQVAMTANREVQIDLDLPAGERLVPLTIGSSVMFRPSEVNPALADSRGLGCQVRLVLH
ncbi:MAG: hypothetical protein AB7H96_05965 [Vicinamibacterales bacterium]